MPGAMRCPSAIVIQSIVWIMKTKIIVIEEVTMIRAFLCEMLNRNGYNAMGVKDGKRAIDIIRDNPGIHLILTDYNMADVTGDDFLKNIRETSLEAIPVIFLTAESDAEKILQAKQAGLVSWVQKPYRIETLFEQVRLAVESTFII